MNGIAYHMKSGTTAPYKRFESRVFEVIASAIRTEQHLLEVGSMCLEWSYNDGYAVVATRGDEPVGYTRLSFLTGGADGFLELGSTWVHPKYRNNGINKEMYRLLLPKHADKNILATTTNLGSIIVGEECGFVAVRRKDLPESIWRFSCCCPLAKTGATKGDNSDCRLAHGEPQRDKQASACWFRVTPQTAERLKLESCVA